MFGYTWKATLRLYSANQQLPNKLECGRQPNHLADRIAPEWNKVISDH